MRVSLVVTGSRGDVQPFIALGQALASRGHDVDLATHQDFHNLVTEAGLGFTELPGSPRDFTAHPALAEALQKGASLFKAARAVPKPKPEATAELTVRVAAAVAGADLVVNSVLTRIVFEGRRKRSVGLGGMVAVEPDQPVARDDRATGAARAPL